MARRNLQVRKLLVIVPLVFAALVVPNAHGDTVYAITFTAEKNAPTVVGSDLVNYNSTLMEFTTPDIEIDYLGNDYNLVATDNVIRDPSGDGFEWLVVPPSFRSAGDPLVIRENGGPGTPIYVDFDDAAAAKSGGHGGVTLTLTLTPTPEPSTASLMLIGIGLLMVIVRKNIVPAVR
jgi:PEP-CTERM motif-containing protein